MYTPDFFGPVQYALPQGLHENVSFPLHVRIALPVARAVSNPLRIPVSKIRKNVI